MWQQNCEVGDIVGRSDSSGVFTLRQRAERRTEATSAPRATSPWTGAEAEPPRVAALSGSLGDPSCPKHSCGRGPGSIGWFQSPENWDRSASRSAPPIPGARVPENKESPRMSPPFASVRMLLRAPPRNESFVESMIGDVNIAVTRSDRMARCRQPCESPGHHPAGVSDTSIVFASWTITAFIRERVVGQVELSRSAEFIFKCPNRERPDCLSNRGVSIYSTTWSECSAQRADHFGSSLKSD